jgi:hypothetical protein
VIVRVASKGQFRLDDDGIQQLNEFENEAVAAVDRGDEAALAEVLHRMLEFVERNGTPLPDEELVPSDLVLPPPDMSVEEAREEFSGEGLLPG